MRQFWKNALHQIGRVLAGPPEPRHPRDQILRALDRTLDHSASGHYVAAAICVEIDRFRLLEESLGSSKCADMLHDLEARLISGPCKRDMLRNFGGGRLVIVPSPNRAFTASMMSDLVADIQTVAAQPIQASEGENRLTVSVGYATQKDLSSPDGEAVLEAANAALMVALRHGVGSRCGYSPEIRQKLDHRRMLSQAARLAMTDGQIHAHFQPQIDLCTKTIVGVEALARWHHKDLGVLSPAEFLPVLEEAGLMHDLGLTILRDALYALQSWEGRGVHIPTVSLNMSTEELLNPLLVDAISFELEAFEIAPDRLVIEILETVVAGAHDSQIMRNIRALRQIGCSIDLDDFGTGHASITTIRQFEVDRIKIDRSFVSNVGQDSAQQDMVRAILTMSQQLHIATLAEGVENESEIDFLSSVGCNIVQGYAVARPMPPEEIAPWACTYLFDKDALPKQRRIN